MESNPFQSRNLEAINRLIRISEKPRYFNQSFAEDKKASFTFEEKNQETIGLIKMTEAEARISPPNRINSMGILGISLI